MTAIVYFTPAAVVGTTDTTFKAMLPLTPESIKLAIEQRTVEFALRFGSVVYPRGVVPRTISFSSIFLSDPEDPLATRGSEPWRSPNEWVALFDRWMTDKFILKIRITETTINHSVFVSRFTPNFSGGLGDTPYDVEFTEFRESEIKPYSIGGSTHQATAKLTRQPLPVPKRYLVKPGDTLITISRRTLGDATRWGEIWALNRTLIANAPQVAAGVNLRIPSG